MYSHYRVAAFPEEGEAAACFSMAERKVRKMVAGWGCDVTELLIFATVTDMNREK